MKIFDAHRHVGKGPAGRYDLARVSGTNYIFNQVSSYRANAKSVPDGDSVSLVFDHRRNLDFVLGEAKKGRLAALKIHSREQRLRESDYPVIAEKLALAPRSLPVIVDAFYYGTELDHQPSLRGIILLATRHPERDFVVAHSGGYEVLKYFCHLRELRNIHYDLSFSLQYLSDSSRAADLAKLIRFTDKRRIMYGSDHPWASPKLQLNVLEGIFRTLDLSAADRERILYKNARVLFKSRPR